MSIYISYHALDYDFAYEILTRMHNLGHIVTLCIPDANQITNQTINSDDQIIVILRPEYLKWPASVRTPLYCQQSVSG